MKMMMKPNHTLMLVLLWLVCGVVVSLADSALPELLKADEQRVKVMLAADEAGLNHVLDDDLHYAHSSGLVEDKKAFVHALVTGSLQYRAFEYEERKFSFPTSDVALMKGVAKIKVVNAKGEVDLRLAYLAVWKLVNGQWKFVAWQSCRLPVAEVEGGAK